MFTTTDLDLNETIIKISIEELAVILKLINNSMQMINEKYLDRIHRQQALAGLQAHPFAVTCEEEDK